MAAAKAGAGVPPPPAETIRAAAGAISGGGRRAFLHLQQPRRKVARVAMAVIPRGIYDICEEKLKQRKTLLIDAERKLSEVRARAYDAKGATLDPNGGGKPQGGYKNPTEKGAAAILEAEKQLELAQKWQEVFLQLDIIFINREEGRIAEAIYQQHKQQLEVAEILHYDRQSIRRFRDVYICHCALLAAEKGLLSVYETAAEEAAADI